MKLFINKIIAFTLSLAVLFATTSFAVDMHFCCNKLVDVAINGKAKSCDEKVQKESTSYTCSLGQEDCCSNQSLVKSADNNLLKVQMEMSADTLICLKTFFYTYISLYEELELNVVPFTNYDPPWIEKDIQVLHETFLI